MARGAFTPLARIALRNVVRNWRHSVGALLSIVVGFVAIGVFNGYLDDLKTKQGDKFGQRYMYGDLLVERRGASGAAGREDPFRFLLDARAQAFLERYLAQRAPEVVNRVRFLALSGLASTGRTGVMFIAWGMDVPEGKAMRGPWAWDTLAGRPLYAAGSDAAILGRGLGALLDCEPDPPGRWIGENGLPIAQERPLRCRVPRVQLTATTESGQLNLVEPRIAGLFDAGLKDVDSKFVMLPLPLAQRLLDTTSISMLSIKLAPRIDAAAFGADLTRAASAAGLELDAMPWTEHPYGETYRRGMELLGLYRTFVVLIVVAIAGMSVFSTMLKAVGERVREIGSLRSLGFRRQHVVLLFALEAAGLAALGSLLGLAASVLATAAINGAGISYKGGLMSEPIPLTVAYATGDYAFAVLFLGGVAVLAALLPARRAARMGIPDALGHT